MTYYVSNILDFMAFHGKQTSEIHWKSYLFAWKKGPPKIDLDHLWGHLTEAVIGLGDPESQVVLQKLFWLVLPYGCFQE